MKKRTRTTNAWKLRKKAWVGTWKRSVRPVNLQGGPLDGYLVNWSLGVTESLPIRIGKKTVGVYRVIPSDFGTIAQWIRIR